LPPSLLVPRDVALAHRRDRLPDVLTAAALDSDLFWTTEAVVEQVGNLGIYPAPRGHKVAVLLVKPPKTLGAIELPDDLRERKTLASTTGVVLGMGPRAYQDEDRFPGLVADCGVGEVVLIPKYAGSVIRVPGRNGETFSIAFIEDDQVIAGWGDASVHASGLDDQPEEPRAPAEAA
jgi:co-chaperonin GroES (HSP10)